MMWLARYCENMTKKAVEREKAQKAAASNVQQTTQTQQATTAQAVQNAKQTETKAEAINIPTIDTTITGTKKLSMAGFLNQ